MTPALKALKERIPNCELHALIAEDTAPALENLPFVEKLWILPRKRGKASPQKSWPIIKALRKEKFDRSVDFVGNDRGAIMSRLIGAKERLGVISPLGFWGRKFCYTTRQEELDRTRHQIIRDFYTLTPWDIGIPENPTVYTQADSKLTEETRKHIPENTVLCHLSTSQQKKEWSLEHWTEFAKHAEKENISIIFSSGPSAREQKILSAIRERIPNPKTLPSNLNLRSFIATLSHAKALVSPDTAPVHLAAGLGIPTLSLFGPTASHCWAPLGEKHIALQGGICPCSGHWHICREPSTCINVITPEEVINNLKKLLSTNK